MYTAYGWQKKGLRPAPTQSRQAGILGARDVDQHGVHVPKAPATRLHAACYHEARARFAFGSWPALFIALSGIVPTLAWRARAEEKLLSRTFGESYKVYRQRTKMFVPYLL